MVGGQTDTVFYNGTGSKHRFARLCKKKIIFNCVKAGVAIRPPKAKIQEQNGQSGSDSLQRRE